MRKIRVIPLVMLGLCLAFVGCKKDRPQPSKEYFKAKTLWIDLLRERRSKAFVAPETEQVIELLQAVDARSLDYTSAQTLLEEIQKGRSEARNSEAALREEIERAKRAGQADPSQIVFQKLPVDAGTVAAAPTAADAGIPKEPFAGMAMAEFTRLFDRCFEFKNDALIGGVSSGQVWGLKDLMGCRQDFPNFISNSVLVADGKVGAIRSNADLAPVKYKMVDGKLVPDDGTPTPAPAPAPKPAPTTGSSGDGRNSANLTDTTPRANQNLTDATPKGNQNLNDVTPKPAQNPNDVTPR